MKTYELCVTYVECALCMCTGVQYLRIKWLFAVSLDTVSLTEPWGHQLASLARWLPSFSFPTSQYCDYK